MLHTKYQGTRPKGFRQEDFSMFFCKTPAWLTCTLPGLFEKIIYSVKFLAESWHLSKIKS